MLVHSPVSTRLNRLLADRALGQDIASTGHQKGFSGQKLFLSLFKVAIGTHGGIISTVRTLTTSIGLKLAMRIKKPLFLSLSYPKKVLFLVTPKATSQSAA
jgi:hypothetical protein